MNPNATTQGTVEPTWCPEDELLVWTVSRIDGGRRHGIEPDCHVVYAVTPSHFVEQTRRYRASAQQCMELLLAGQRAGTIQRKVELDTIMAVHSDPRSGRLIVKTLNGAHRLDPINEEEAGVLREIAIQLELRMPAGGAVLRDPVSLAYQGPERRRSTEQDDWLAMRSVANARSEDEVDTAPGPHYGAVVAARTDVPPAPPGMAERPAPGGTVEAAGPDVDADRRVPATPAADVSAPPVAPADAPVHQDPGPVPADITVAGGIPITYAPPAGRPPFAEPPSDGRSTVAAPPAVPHQGTAPAQPAAPDLEAFDRRVRRARPDVGSSPALEPEGATRPDAGLGHVQEPEMTVRPDPDSGPVPEPQATAPEAGPIPSAGAPFAGPSSTEPLDGPRPRSEDTLVDRRKAEDPGFPSIFDRRRAGPGFRASDDVPNWVSGGPVDDADDVDPPAPGADRTDPPTLAVPPGSASPAGSELGESVGFNPDFDVNPFR